MYKVSDAGRFCTTKLQGRKVHSLLAEFKEVALPTSSVASLLQPHLPFTLDTDLNMALHQTDSSGGQGQHLQLLTQSQSKCLRPSSRLHNPPPARSCCRTWTYTCLLRGALSQKEPQNFTEHLERASCFRKMPFWALGPASIRITVDNLKKISPMVILISYLREWVFKRT